MTAATIALAIYALTIGVPHVPRLAALVFSIAMTLQIVEGGNTPRPRATAMVSMAAFMLVLEGASNILSQEMDKASYIEFAIGLYLLTTLYRMVARTTKGSSPAPRGAVKQVIVVRRDLKMRQGKSCSQTGHASGEFMREQILGALDGGSLTFSDEEIAWMRGGMAKITVRTDSIEQFEDVRDRAIAAGLKVRVITDAGHTEFHGVPTVTALAIGPDRADIIDTITKAEGRELTLL